MKTPDMKWYLFLFVLFMSCTKVVSVNLNEANQNIVIEGRITDDPGPYRIQITETVDFSAPNFFPPVSGASVKITDSVAGISDSLIEISPGVYSTQTLVQGLPGHTYQLFVSINGQSYTASSTMPDPVTLDSVSFYSRSVFGTTSINAVANFQDPEGIANYYTFTEYINNKHLDRTFEFNDRLSDGKYIRQQLFNDSTYIQPGDEVMIQMNCVDKQVWEYFSTLRQATGNNFQSVSPTNPISNISNKALGYFSAQTVQWAKSTFE